MKRDIKLYISIFLTIILVVVITSFAWFYQNDQNTIYSDSNMKIQVGGNLEIGNIADNGDVSWGNELEITTEDPIYINDCTGTGRKDEFYYPLTLDADDIPVGPLVNVNDAPKEETYFIEYKFKLRSSNKQHVYLTNQSFVEPLTRGTNSNQSTYGSFTADYIAGCVRVAFLEVDESSNEELKFVWIPNCNYSLSKSTVQNGINEDGTPRYETNYSMTESGTRESSYGYLVPNEESYERINYTSNDYLNGSVVVTDANKDNLCAPSSDVFSTKGVKPIVSFENDGVLEVKTVIIRIWFEGTDRESHAALNKGQVSYKFCVSGMNKLEPKEEDLAIFDSIYYDQESRKLCYLNENNEVVEATGLVEYYTSEKLWTILGPNKTFSPSTTSLVYIRLYETRTNLGSLYRETGEKIRCIEITPPPSE